MVTGGSFWVLVSKGSKLSNMVAVTLRTADAVKSLSSGCKYRELYAPCVDECAVTLICRWMRINNN